MKHEGLWNLVASNPPLDSGKAEEEDCIVAALPGDSIEKHLLYENFAQNPFRGMNPQKVARALANGEISDSTARRHAEHWIRLYESLSGDRVSGGPRRI